MKTRHLLSLLALCISLAVSACSISPPGNKGDEAKVMEFVEVPDGFRVTLFADNVPNARAMCWGDEGTLFVGSRNAGNVYAILDDNQDNIADTVITIAEDIQMPAGVAFRNGSLYVSATDRILRFDNIESQLYNPPQAVVVSDAFPDYTHHGWKFIDFGPDGKLYVPVGAPCNICLEDPEVYSTIMRMNPDGSGLETYAKGIRNTVGFAWHPETDELWFTENGRDWMGDDMPPCELNYAPEAGMHFGFPYCHGGQYPDDEFTERDCSEFVAPAINFEAHVAPLGMCFYTGDMFPEEYRNQILVAEHGSWNRSTKIGYRVNLVTLSDNETAEKWTPFATGFEVNGDVYGRPVDVLQMPDGSILVSDDHANAIYRISYSQ